MRLFAGVLSVSFVLWLAGCGGSAGLGPITITAASSTVDGTDTTTLTATVTNDKNTAGVAWTASAGTLSNTTTTSATFTAPAATSSPQSITITATSVADSTKTGTVTITVPAAPAIASLTTAQGTVSVGTAYSVALTGTGGVAPYKWALASGSGSLPPCLSLSSSGTLSSPAIPTAACAGVYSGIKFTLTDSGTPNALTATSSAQTITVVGPTLAFNATLPAGVVGAAYAGGVTASGVLGTTTYSLKGSFPTSGHLTFNTSTGAITGTPYANDVGTYNFTVTVVDQYGDTLTSVPLALTINAPTITFAVPAATATVGTAYSSGAGASGTAGTTTYTLQGSLPSSGHLVFNTSTGAITGTPYAGDTGTYSFKVSVTDQYGDTATSGTESIVVGPAQAITFGVAPAATGTFNSAYSSAVTASGGAGTLTYALAAGSTLPPDLSLATNGALAGTLNKATDVGTFSFSVKASDNYGDSATSPVYQIVVTYPPVVVTSLLPPTGYAGAAYPNTTLTATGGNSGPYTWTWAAASGSALPPGLSLSSAGAIGGTPAAGSAGTYSVVVTATDNATPANSGQTTLIFTIKPGITINSITLPEGYAGSSYPPTGGNSTVTATGGTGTYTWTMAGATGSSVPSGLSINPTTGLIGGTLAASSAGNYSVVVTATDNATPANTASITLALTIGAAVSIAATNPQPNAYPGAAYTSNTFTGSGGNGGPYNWTLTAASGSSVPVGFTIGAGPSATTTITAASPSNTGTTTAAYNVVVTAKDSLGNQYSTNATINVEATLNVTSPATLPGVSVGVNPNYQLTAAGGSGTYTNGWTVTSGAASLAAVGLSVTSNGVLTGTSPTAGTANFAVTVKDTEGHVSAAANLTVTVTSALTITTTTLPGGNAGSNYAQTLVAAGGSGTYSNWQITSGASTLTALGLSLNATTGVISGKPSTTGTASFTVQVTDSASHTATQNLTIQIYSALSLPAPDPGSLPSTAYAGYPYNGGGSGVIMGSGGSGNLTISIASGLPAYGLSAVASGAQLSVSGTPATTPTPPSDILMSPRDCRGFQAGSGK
ncbi:MAG: beta strand repeat-containing protein [Terracidiphilus sp.]